MNSAESQTTPTVDAIGQMAFEGNIIPQSWYQHITFESGRPDLLGVVLLAEICYWYRPTEIRDEATGALLGYRKKFKSDMLQRSYQSFADQFGASKRQVRDAIHRLEERDLLRLEFRTVQTAAGTLSNVLFLEPIVEQVQAITYPRRLAESKNSQQEQKAKNQQEIPPPRIGDDVKTQQTSEDRTPPPRGGTFERRGCYVQTSYPLRLNVTPPTFERNTYTEITTEITTETNLPNTGIIHIGNEDSVNEQVGRQEDDSPSPTEIRCEVGPEVDVDNTDDVRNTDNIEIPPPAASDAIPTEPSESTPPESPAPAADDADADPDPDEKPLAVRLWLFAQQKLIRAFPLVNANPSQKATRELKLPAETAARRDAIYKRVAVIGDAIGEERCFLVVGGVCENLLARRAPVWCFEYFLYSLHQAYRDHLRSRAEITAESCSPGARGLPLLIGNA